MQGSESLWRILAESSPRRCTRCGRSSVLHGYCTECGRANWKKWLPHLLLMVTLASLGLLTINASTLWLRVPGFALVGFFGLLAVSTVCKAVGAELGPPKAERLEPLAIARDIGAKPAEGLAEAAAGLERASDADSLAS